MLEEQPVNRQEPDADIETTYGVSGVFDLNQRPNPQDQAFSVNFHHTERGICVFRLVPIVWRAEEKQEPVRGNKVGAVQKEFLDQENAKEIIVSGGISDPARMRGFLEEITRKSSSDLNAICKLAGEYANEINSAVERRRAQESDKESLGNFTAEMEEEGREAADRYLNGLKY